MDELIVPDRSFRGLVLAACLSLVTAIAARAAPMIPASDAVILEKIPAARDPSSRTLRQLDAQLAADPHNLGLAVRTARLDIDLSRRLADPRFLGRAEAALAPWPIGDRTPAPVLLLRAVVLQSNHHFDASLAALAQVLRDDPRNGQAYLTRAAILTVQARYREALAACGQVAGMILGLVPDTCTAAVESMTGRAPLALRVVTLSLQVNAEEAAKHRGAGVWAETLAAEIADRLGDPTAESRYRAALAMDSTDPYLLAAWSDFLLAHGRPREVVTLLADQTRIDPLLLRLAMAEQALRLPGLARHVSDLADRFEAAHLRHEVVHRREEAMFRLLLLDDPAGALPLAEANWTVQREPADALILLQAARAAQRPEAAAPVVAWMKANAVQSVVLSALAAPAGKS